MKILAATMLLLVTSLCYGDLAVYNGALVTKTISEDGSSTVTARFIEVVDLSNSKIAVIKLGINQARKRTFSVEPAADVIQTEVKDSRNKRTFLVLAQAGTTGLVPDPVMVSSFLQVGAKLKVTIRTGEKAEAPRHLQGSSTVVATADGDLASEYVDTKSTLILQEVLSRTINDAGDTLEAAVERIKADLMAKGYVAADA
jgi:hypothetical protein